jgi:aminomethyltransferase
MKTVYTDAIEEYRTLRGGCGLLEHEGTGLLVAAGPDAAAFVGQMSTRTVDFLLEGQSSAGLLLTHDGAVLAEALIHCRAGSYLIEIWAAQAEQARAHLTAAAQEFPGVTLDDVTEAYAVFGLEGPESFGIVAGYLPFPVSSMAYRSFVTTTWGDGVPLLVSRTGVTGEYGYKLHVPAEHAEGLRAELLAAGAQPCGVDALDICRMEMRFANLEGESGGSARTPFQLGLQWMVDFDHEFVGREALLELWESGMDTLPVCWIAEDESSVADMPPGNGLALTIAGTPIGHVAHAVHSPNLGRVIGTALVDRAVAGSGLTYQLGSTERAVRTVSAPFLVATSFGVPLA